MFFNLCSRELMDPEHRFTYPDGINGSMEINIGFSSAEEVDREYVRYVQNGGLMRVGEVSILTNDVVKVADFYKALLEVDNNSNDTIHQTIISEETMLTIYNDGKVKKNSNQNICLAFTVDDIEKEYQKVLSIIGAEIIEKPTLRPWGAINMSFYDPDRNMIYLRSFVK